MRIEVLLHATLTTVPVALFVLSVIFFDCDNKMADNIVVQPRSQIRSAFGRVIYDKLASDEQMAAFNKTLWYQCDMKLITLRRVSVLFHQLQYDKETEEFIDQCIKKSDWLPTQIYHSVAKFFLGWFMTQTSINGLLNRGSMFVFSRQHLSELFPMYLGRDVVLDRLLDLGAGDGAVTDKLRPHFRQIDVTEVSRPMRWLLKDKNYNVLEGLESWMDLDYKYDMISCLNVLDRCDMPLTMLRNMSRKLTPEGKIIVAVVLPFKPYVESGANNNHEPTEVINVKGETFEEQVQSLTMDVFLAEGWIVEKWARVPYLCEGDMHQSYYWLDDALFVMRRLPFEAIMQEPD